MKSWNRKYAILAAMLPLWFLLYHYLEAIASWLVFDALQLNQDARYSEALRFFLFEVPKVLMLLALIIFVVGIIRTYFSPERTRRLLEHRTTLFGNILASLLGIVTPFCSCSAIPLFLGFVESGVPLGVTFSFLIAAPMINEVAVVLLLGLFGWKVALIYVVTGLAIAIMAGWIIGRLRLEKWVQDWVYSSNFGSSSDEENGISFTERVQRGLDTVKEIVGKVWVYILLGIAVGAFAHGYVPEDYMATLMGKSAWYSVPLSVLIGIPLYSNAAGIVPIVSVLLEKGASLGPSLAFMMSVIALSLPEVIILKKVLKLPLIVTFVGIVGVGIMLVGYLFNLLF